MTKHMRASLNSRRTIGWISGGAASAVAFKLVLSKYPEAIPVYCETGTEHPDNIRFLAECEGWFGKPIKRIKSQKYEDTWDVWMRRKYLSGIKGAPCSVELKVAPRLAFQHPSDLHIFGYTADRPDQTRALRFRINYPELAVETPLIEQQIDKSECLEFLRTSGIAPPKMYELGFKNSNCIPCVKATSPAYWALIRKTFPAQFSRMATLSRKLGAKLCRLHNERIFIDEIPHDYRTTGSTSISCDFLCHLSMPIRQSLLSKQK